MEGDVGSGATGAFGFLDVDRLPPKPRTRKITGVNDRRLSHQQVRCLVEVAGDCIDLVKVPDHFGLIARFGDDWLRDKFALYHDAGIETTLGGALYEVAAVQGKVERYFERAADLGLQGVEVSEDIIPPQSPEVRSGHIGIARSLGLKVFTEIGRKFPDTPFDPVEAAELAQRDLEAGSSMVVVENSDIRNILHAGSDALHRFVEQMPFEKLIFEVGPNERMVVARWMLTEFGPEVNLENVEIEDAAAIAAMRAGLHRQMDFSYFDGRA